MPRLIYLHGFASGPQSSKAQFFRHKLAEAGLELEIPDLTEGDFENTTLSQQLALLGPGSAGVPPASGPGSAGVPPASGPGSAGVPPASILIGSSMGGYLAALFAARHPEQVAGIVLLAPAFGLAKIMPASLGDAVMQDWKEKGWRAVHHYGENKEARIGYGLIEDASQYEEFPDVRQPALAIHGRRDADVDYRLSVRFARNRPNVKLVLYDSDHQLLDVLEPMWQRVWDFVKGT